MHPVKREMLQLVTSTTSKESGSGPETIYTAACWQLVWRRTKEVLECQDGSDTSICAPALFPSRPYLSLSIFLPQHPYALLPPVSTAGSRTLPSPSCKQPTEAWCFNNFLRHLLLPYTVYKPNVWSVLAVMNISNSGCHKADDLLLQSHILYRQKCDFIKQWAVQYEPVNLQEGMQF